MRAPDARLPPCTWHLGRPVSSLRFVCPTLSLLHQVHSRFMVASCTANICPLERMRALPVYQRFAEHPLKQRAPGSQVDPAPSTYTHLKGHVHPAHACLPAPNTLADSSWSSARIRSPNSKLAAPGALPITCPCTDLTSSSLVY